MIIRGDENPFLRGAAAKEHLSSFFTETTNPFGSMSVDEKAEAALAIGKHHSERFNRCLERLDVICRSYNFFELLTHFGYYDQLLLDPESKNPKYKPVEQSSVELLQALILRATEEEISGSLKVSPPPEILVEVNTLLHDITTSFSLKRYGEPVSRGNDARLVSEMVRIGTAKGRNPGFPSQARRTMTELVAPLNEAFEKKTGVRLTGLAQMLWNVADLISDRVSASIKQRSSILRLTTKKEIIDKFIGVYIHDQVAAKQYRLDLGSRKYGIKKLRQFLYSECDHLNLKLFWLSNRDWISAYPGQIDVAALTPMLEQWSLAPSDLSASNAEHFFLDNPIWSRPIIDCGPDFFFFPLPITVQSFGLQMLEAVMQNDADLWQQYQERIRPKYLERSVAQTFRAALPSAGIHQGVHWRSSDGSQNFETDLFIILDAHVLIIECKAGHFTPRGRRGDLARLKNDFGRLIEEPTVQSKRFTDLLTEEGGPIDVEDATGVKFTIDRSKIIRIARANVTLDYFGIVGIQARLLREAGMIDKNLTNVPTFHLHEIENIVEILDQPTMLLHYLNRRSELEADHNIVTWERGMLAFYLATGFDLGGFETEGPKTLMIPTMDDELLPYFMGKELKRPVPKPQRRFTPWWNDMLKLISQRKTQAWMESSYALLSVGYEDQQRFEDGVHEMLQEVDANWKDPEHKNTLILVTGSPKRKITILCVGVKDVTIQEQRDTVMRSIGVADEIQVTTETLAIVRSLTTQRYPYSATYFFKGESE